MIGGAVDAALQGCGISRGARVVWMPNEFLSLLPLSLAHDERTDTRLGEIYDLVVTPTLESFADAIRQVAEPAKVSLAAIINPTGDLTYTEVEGSLVASHFDPSERKVLTREAASPSAVLAALSEQSYWHFSCHGTFDWSDARLSGLVLSDEHVLSVDDLAQFRATRRPRLVALSACETGLYGLKDVPDEFTGLPTAFISLGAAGVLSTLWLVDDRATAFLVSKFYDLHLGEGLPPSVALNRSQVWLRDVTQADLVAYVRFARDSGRISDPGIGAMLENSLARRHNIAGFELVWELTHKATPVITSDEVIGVSRSRIRTGRPFAHPYYWGAFIYTGL
jgi:CHAT domain-containing protein